jgi:thioester reductase-like protein
MLPGRIVVLDTLPTLPNGKVDRKRLPAVADAGSEPASVAAATYAPPTTPEEMRLVQIWRDLLGADRIGVSDNFFDLGGNSLTIVQMAARVREAFGVSIGLKQLFENPTVAALAGMLNSSRAGALPVEAGARSMAPAELVREAVLPEDVVPHADAVPPICGNYRRILLTGGTGYTGAFLLRELLDRSSAEIDVLARADNADDAVARVQRNMESYGLWRESDAARLHGVAGDIGRPWFGLSRADYAALAQRTEMIVHNGALSNYAQSYWQLKPVNVLGTLEVLRLACRQRIKPVHYISSLAVFPVLRGDRRFEEIELDSPEDVIGGYQQTKWVADRLVMQAGQRGLPVCVYRPGQITGAQTSGAASTDTFLNAVIKGCIQVRAALPFDITLEMVPVDYCAAAVSHIALSGRHLGQAFHLTGSRTLHWDEVMEMIRTCGYPLRTVAYAEWYRAVVSAVERGEDNELAKYLMLFNEQAPSRDVGEIGAALSFGSERLQVALAGSGIQCGPIDARLMATYLDFFRRSGYLNAA